MVKNGKKKITVNQLDIAAVQNQKGEVFFLLLTTTAGNPMRFFRYLCSKCCVGITICLECFCLFVCWKTNNNNIQNAIVGCDSRRNEEVARL